MKKYKSYILIILSILNFSCNNEVDLIIVNSEIYTANENNQIAKSIAVKDGKIIEVSSENLVSKYEANEILDAKGKPFFQVLLILIVISTI